MAAINFPSSPTPGQSHTENGQTWYYDGVKWVSGGTFGQSALTPMYQQGDWIPVVDDGTITYEDISTKWTRVGNLVTVWGRISNISSNLSEQLRIGGLPYRVDLNVCGGSVFYSFASAGSTDYTAPYASGDRDVGGSVGGRISFYKSGTSSFASIGYNELDSSSAIVYFSAFYSTEDTTFVPINGATVS